MRQIYYYNSSDDNLFIGTGLVEDNHQLLVGETFIKPADGLNWPLRFDEKIQRWYGLTDEEWLKTNPFHGNPQDSQPSQQQEIIASLLKQNASLQKQVKAQATVNAVVMKDLAELKSKVK